ncbi:VWA domain-containing protein [Terriglobus tenax]|uniref:VWA domain-containing protein n=1 Tax=Terriglobus tenax TaxID=1111115 RepID=UPI0021E02E37|nr:VWA domain-containing protein [Terriglobus tenax]
MVLLQGGLSAQEENSRIRINVVLVQLSVTVTDAKGNYIGGLKPEDFVVTEDKIPERLAGFEEGVTTQTRATEEAAPTGPPAPVPTFGEAALPASTVVAGPQATGANVFILFDTSNYMYRGFVFAQDAIADFIRSLEGVSNVAFYSYSRNLSKITPLTGDRGAVLRGVRNTVAGDDEALYNSLLLTLKDAAPLRGRKAIVVFSNGPDNASMVPPEDVAELAQSTGTIIYMISTRDALNDEASMTVFERISKATGGKAYFSKSWKDEKAAFESIREDLAHLYSLSYYPAPNPNQGWRTITVRLTGKNMQKFRIRTREGYRLQQTSQVAPIAPPAREWPGVPLPHPQQP